MVEAINFDDWQLYNGLSSGSGSSEKCWLQSETGDIGLFKYPKVDEYGNVSSTEYISEHIASQIGRILGVPTAKIDIGYRNGRIGCMSYLISDSMEEGIYFISAWYPSYDTNTLYASDDKWYYSLGMIANSVRGLKEGWFIPMLLFDFLIGNSDRHQNNWAIEVNENHIPIGLGPLYDNGSSLCSYIQEKDIDSYRKDKMRFDALVKSKSKSRIRIDGNIKKEPTHSDVVRYVLDEYDIAYYIAENYVEKLTDDQISMILEAYPTDILSVKKKELIDKFLKAKRDHLVELVKEVVRV